MGFDDSNHILFMYFMKSMCHLTFLSNKQEIDIFMKNHPTRRHTSPLTDIAQHEAKNYIDIVKSIAGYSFAFWPKFMKFEVIYLMWATWNGSDALKL